MSGPSLTVAQPLLKEIVPQNRGKVVALISLLGGMAFVAFLSQAFGEGEQVRDSTVDMALQGPMQGLQPRTQFAQPVPSAKTLQSMKPLRAGQFMRSAATPQSNNADLHSAVAPVSNPLSRRGALASGLATVAMIPRMAEAEQYTTQGRGTSGGRFNSREFGTPEEMQAYLLEEQRIKKEEAKKRIRMDARPKEEKDAEQAGKFSGVLYAGGAAVALSVPFYFANLQRLGTKVISGGADDGYGNQRRTVRGKPAAKSKTPEKKGGFFR